MIDFRHPEFLPLFLVLPALGYWWLARHRGSLRHPTAVTLRAVPGIRGPIAFWGGFALRMLALTSLVLAVAGPRIPDLKSRVRTEGIAIVMVVDVSGSMGTEDFKWGRESIARLEAVKRSFRLFVAGGEVPNGEKMEGRPTDLIGLVAFATLPDTACPLTLSHSALLRSLDEQKPRTIPGESETNIIDATAWGLYRLRTAGPRRKVLIVLSDGEHNVTSPASGWKLQNAIRIARAQGVPIYAIDAAGTGVSTAEGNQQPTVESREAAEKTLRMLAEGTDGQYFRADNTEALLDVYRAIDHQERLPVDSWQYHRWHEGAGWFGLAAFVFFVLVMGLESTVFRRVP